jgi:hypothetical protein
MDLPVEHQYYYAYVWVSWTQDMWSSQCFMENNTDKMYWGVGKIFQGEGNKFYETKFFSRPIFLPSYNFLIIIHTVTLLSWPILPARLLKSKAIPVMGHEDSWGCDTSRLPRFLDSRLTDGSDVSLPCRVATLYPQECSWYSFLIEAELIPGP